MRDARTVVMSIHRHHAARIYALDKPYEFRRVGSGFTRGDKVLIYETSPICLVTGEAVVDEVQSGSGRVLSALEPDANEREHVTHYLSGARRPVALRFAQVLRYSTAYPLRDLGIVRAPQSYQFVEV